MAQAEASVAAASDNGDQISLEGATIMQRSKANRMASAMPIQRDNQRFTIAASQGQKNAIQNRRTMQPNIKSGGALLDSRS